MKKGKRKIASVILSMVLVFAMVAELFLTPDGLSTVKKAFAAEGNVQLGYPVMSEDGNTFSFANAEIKTEKTYTTMSISVNKGYIVPNKKYPWTLTDLLTQHRTATWTWQPGKTTADVQEILRSIEFSHVDGIQVDITLDTHVSVLPNNALITSYKMYNDDMTMYKTHYYMYVAKSGISWTNAYSNSKTYSYLGMPGYMTTITELGEDLTLDNITGGSCQAWAGGVRDDYDVANSRVEHYSSLDAATFSSAANLPDSVENSVWVWACGPEAGTYIPVEGPATVTKNIQYKSYDANAGINSLVLDDPKMNEYSNWTVDYLRTAASSNGEPNNYGGNEWCMLVHFGTPAQHSQYGWNDYKNTESVQGYFVEFGGYDEDPWFDAETGLPVDGSDDGPDFAFVQLNERWVYEVSDGSVVAHCELVLTDKDGNEDIQPTDVTKELTPNIGDYYEGNPYTGTGFPNQDAYNEFLTMTGMKPTDIGDPVYYTDEDCTIPTAADDEHGGAAGSGKAPTKIGRYYVKRIFHVNGEDLAVIDYFNVLPNPIAEENTQSHFTPDPEATAAPVPENITGYQRQNDGAVVITGFWAETDPEKKLVVQVGGAKVNVDMSGVLGKNFTVTIGGGFIGDATEVYVYHQDTPGKSTKIYLKLFPKTETLADTWATVTWKSISGISQYMVDVSFDNEFDNVLASYTNRAVNATNITITGLTPETRYYVRLRANLGSGNYSAYSYYCEFVTLPEGSEEEDADKYEVHTDRENYTIGDDGILPKGLLYGEIDYDTSFIRDAVLYAKDNAGNTVKTTYINLTTEVFVTDLAYNYYSTNNGKTWTKAKKPIDAKKLQSLLKKGFTLKLLKGNVVKNKPAEDSIVYSFEKVNARPKISTVKVNYLIYGDYSGLSNGQWTLTIQGTQINTSLYMYGVADETGKKVSSKGFGLWPYMDGVWVKDLVDGKQLKEKYFVKIPAHGYTPASASKKVTVYGVAKPSKKKVNYTYESVSIDKDSVIYYGEQIPDTRADKYKLIKTTDESPFEYLDAAIVTKCEGKTKADYLGYAFKDTPKPVKIELGAYITDERNTVLIWKAATDSKPASAKQVIKLAARGPAADEETSFTVKNGTVKLKIDKTTTYAYFEAGKGKWKTTAPKITANTIVTIRFKCTARGGKENDTQFATGYESYLVLEYGVYKEKTGKQGIIGAKAFTTLEAAQAYLETLNTKNQPSGD